MTAPLRILVATNPAQLAIFRIEQHHIDAAMARCTLALPALAFDFCAIDGPDFIETLGRAYALLGFRFPADRIRPHGQALKLIQLSAAGMEHLLPLDWLPKQVALATASGVHGPKLREWAGMVFMMLHTHMPHFITAQRAHEWSKAFSSPIAGRRALIYGTGGLGTAIAGAAHRLGIVTTGVRRTPAPVRGFDSVIGVDAARDVIGEADFVVLATPLTPATRHMMNADMFARMRKGAGFANFGRGGLVDQDAMIAALTARHVGGAIIDVTDPEPPPAESPLWDTPNLVITPHVSCDDPDAYIPRTLDIFLDNLARSLAGRTIRNRVVPSRAY
ncbi:D-2-hydroxyacid dehydrogenase [Acidisoma cladoniae]|jgi:phosphoglycerate dehydrogenase-like enzyme|uniref:D-2-hydroxyacid dehydrogenase n=1 Tax=Acidisoma cladoniae TaxID=3040935 RepID=UPI00254D964C|nr:D-2-hydroxyacid dehydrogenase [Acidisoma sp. PAMC 29798]